MDIEKVQKSLERNEVLTDEVKTNLFELILIFNKHYKDVSLDLLAERLEDVNFEVVSKYISKEPIVYNSHTNVIQINEEELEKTNNTKHILMVALLHMISITNRKDRGPIDAFRDGYANIIANNLVGSEDLNVNEIITNELGILIGEGAKEVFDAAFFTDNLTKIVVALLEQGIDKETIETFLKDWNYDTVHSKSTGSTKFGELQYKLAQLTKNPEEFKLNGAFKPVHLDSDQIDDLGVYGKTTEEMLESLKRENKIVKTM